METHDSPEYSPSALWKLAASVPTRLICKLTTGKENMSSSVWQDASEPKGNSRIRVRRDKISYIFTVESNFMHHNTNVSQGRELGQVENVAFFNFYSDLLLPSSP